MARMTRAELAGARRYVEDQFIDGRITEEELDQQLAELQPRKRGPWRAIIATGIACLLIGGGLGIEVGYLLAPERRPMRVIKEVITIPVAPKSLAYDSVTDLRDAAVSAGYSCSSWQQHNRVTLALESGSCSDRDVFSIYRGPEDAAYAAMSIPSFGKPKHLLVGQNWIINARLEDLRKLQPYIGGTLWDE